MIRKIILMCMAVVLFEASSSPAVECDEKGYAEGHIAPVCYWKGASTKLVRGATNTVTSPVEIPKQMFMATRENFIAGPVLGVFRGVGMGVSRLVYGVAEMGTFLLPNDIENRTFKPVFEPEYVWESEK